MRLMSKFNPVKVNEEINALEEQSLSDSSDEDHNKAVLVELPQIDDCEAVASQSHN